jgi:hypothetical protein
MILTLGFQKEVAVQLIFLLDAMTAGAPTVNEAATAAVPIVACLRNALRSIAPPVRIRCSVVLVEMVQRPSIILSLQIINIVF